MKKVRKFLLILLMMATAVSNSLADKGKEPYKVWILCQPNSYVNVRLFPKKTLDEEIGRLELGDQVWTDGIKKHGFLHVFGSFETDGWVSCGYVSETTVITGEFKAKIVSRGRVRARRSVKGTRRKWLKNGRELLVFGYGDEWAVTDEGFVQTKYLEMEEL